MGRIAAICISAEKGTPKTPMREAFFIPVHGIEGDAHAGSGHRQVSLLQLEKIEAFRARGADVQDGAFGENIVVEGIDLRALPVGALLRGGGVLLRITQLGKACHSGCSVYRQIGDCIMPREGVFAEVLTGGTLRPGDELRAERAFRAAVITLSDKASQGEREDLSGAAASELLDAHGYQITERLLLPDDRAELEAALRHLCDGSETDLILTTGGTGLSPRDHTPEATLAVAERAVPGIAEALRAHSMTHTGRAMFSRAVAAVRGRTLIINLPGSPKAVQESLAFLLPELWHGLETLTGRGGECAR